jgi:hypothetical protein
VTTWQFGTSQNSNSGVIAADAGPQTKQGLFFFFFFFVVLRIG